MKLKEENLFYGIKKTVVFFSAMCKCHLVNAENYFGEKICFWKPLVSPTKPMLKLE